MSEEEKELVETYREMIPENKASFLAYGRVALAAQENAKKAMTDKTETKPPSEAQE